MRSVEVTMSPTPEVDGGHHPAQGMGTPRKSSPKTTPTLIGGCRRTSPNKSARKTPIRSNKSKMVTRSSQSSPKPDKLVNDVVGGNGRRDEPSVKKPDSFQDHKELCDRVAKSLYFANKLPTTPRPSLPLTKLAVSAFTSKARQDTLEFLDLEQAAEIGRNACISPTALIMSIVYLERLSATNPGYLGSIKPSELFVVSLLVASKFIQDDGEELGIFNDEWATSAHLDLRQLNRMELEFLTAIDWRVKVDPGEYGRVLRWLEKEVALEEGGRRGWFTYSEVTTLLSFHLLWPTIYQHCVKVITAACLTYATLLATLASSLFVGPQIFLMSKTCLTSLTSTGPNYQPFNSTTETLHLGSECCKFTQGKTENQETMDTENLDFDLEDQVSKRLGFENGTDSAIGYMMIRSKKWSQPGLSYHFQTTYGLNPEFLFTHELQRFFQNQNMEQQKQKTAPGAFTGKCYHKKSSDPQDMGRCSDRYSEFNNRFSSFHGLPYIK